MDSVIKLHTEAQVVAALLHGKLNQRQRKQLAQIVCTQCSISSVIEVAGSLPPKYLELACCGEERIRRIKVSEARDLLKRIPISPAYQKARKSLLKKFLRQPIRGWLYTSFEDRVWGWSQSEVGSLEVDMFVDVVVRSRSPELAHYLSTIRYGSGSYLLTEEQRERLKPLTSQWFR